MWGIAVEAWCLRLNTMQSFPSSRSADLLAVKLWLVPAVTNITCATSRCSWEWAPTNINPTGSLATLAFVQQLGWCKLPTWDKPDSLCLAGSLELQHSTVAGIKTCQNGALQTPYRAQQVQSKATDTRPKEHIPGLTSPAQHVSSVPSFTSANKNLTTRWDCTTSKLRYSAIYLILSICRQLHRLNKSN